MTTACRRCAKPIAFILERCPFCNCPLADPVRSKWMRRGRIFNIAVLALVVNFTSLLLIWNLAGTRLNSRDYLIAAPNGETYYIPPAGSFTASSRKPEPRVRNFAEPWYSLLILHFWAIPALVLLMIFTRARAERLAKGNQ